MWQMMAAQAAMKAIGGIIGGNKQKAAEYAQATSGYQQEQLAWGKNTSDNKAIADANLTNQIRTGFKMGLLNVQQAQSKKRLMQDGLDLGRMRQQALGAAHSNAAAAGTVGPSVDAVVGDIEQRVQEASAVLVADAEQTSDNFGTQLTEMLWAGEDVLRSPEQYYAMRQEMPTGFKYGESMFGAVLDVGATYMSNKMSLGMGQSAAAGAASSGASSAVASAPAASGG